MNSLKLSLAMALVLAFAVPASGSAVGGGGAKADGVQLADSSGVGNGLRLERGHSGHGVGDGAKSTSPVLKGYANTNG